MNRNGIMEHVNEIIRTCDNSPCAINKVGTIINVDAIKANERDLCTIRALAECAKKMV